jgi:hypothetical protein
MQEGIKRYPKSDNNNQCIGPCYAAGTEIIHPITLTYTKDIEAPFCPINPILDDIKGKNTIYVDHCSNPTNMKDIINKKYEIDILVPSIEFNPENFLKIFYNIQSFEGAIEWIKEKRKISLTSRMRILNCALDDEIKITSITDDVVNIFIEIVNKKWITDIYTNVGKHIEIDYDEYYYVDDLETVETKVDNDKFLFITNKLLTTIEIHKFLVKYFKNRREMSDEQDHLFDIKIQLIKYIINKIKITFPTKTRKK